MPMDRSKYPDNWDEIALAVKERAGWKCESCGVEHDTYIIREKAQPDHWRYVTDTDEDSKGIKHVVLTAHHAGVAKPDGTPGDPSDKLDNRPENLKCLCQRCHLLADQVSHMAHASVTRATKKHARQIEAGQEELFT